MRGVKHKWLNEPTKMVCLHVPLSKLNMLDAAGVRLRKNRSQLVRILIDNFCLDMPRSVNRLLEYENQLPLALDRGVKSRKSA